MVLAGGVHRATNGTIIEGAAMKDLMERIKARASMSGVEVEGPLGGRTNPNAHPPRDKEIAEDHWRYKGNREAPLPSAGLPRGLGLGRNFDCK